MGAGRELSYLIKNNIAGAFTDVKLLGGSMSDITEIQKNLVDSTNKQIILQREYYDDLYATTKVTGEYSSTLINAFDNVGRSVYSIRGEMEGVVNNARRLGLDATEVSSRMVSNLEKMNMYGFERGIQGLSNMAAKSAMFKLDMSSTFNLADKLISPEQAVEFSARLQNLGIQSELIDPFRAMDLATNDIEELQNQIIKLGDGMTYYNKETGKVDITKESRGKIRALATEMGMSASELSKMIVQSETAKRKMAEITMPDFKVSEENKMMIANLAQFKEGRGYVVQIEDEKGKVKEKLVSELDENEIRKLADQVANPKTMEDLAKDQIDFLSDIANSLEAIEKGPGMGIAGSRVGEGVVDITKAADALVYKPLAKGLDSGRISDIIDNAGENLSKIYTKITDGVSGFDGTVDGFKTLFSGTLNDLGESMQSGYAEFNANLERLKRLGTFANYGEALQPSLDYRPDKVGEVKDGYVFGEGNNKKVVNTSITDQSVFAQRDAMIKLLSGEDIMKKMKEMTIQNNNQNNNNQIFNSIKDTLTGINTVNKEVNHKMEPIKHEGDIKITMDFANVPSNLDTRMLSEAFKNNQGLMEVLVNSIKKKMDNNNFTNSPKDYNSTYVNYA